MLRDAPGAAVILEERLEEIAHLKVGLIVSQLIIYIWILHVGSIFGVHTFTIIDSDVF